MPALFINLPGIWRKAALIIATALLALLIYLENIGSKRTEMIDLGLGKASQVSLLLYIP